MFHDGHKERIRDSEILSVAISVVKKIKQFNLPLKEKKSEPRREVRLDPPHGGDSIQRGGSGRR